MFSGGAHKVWWWIEPKPDFTPVLMTKKYKIMHSPHEHLVLSMFVRLCHTFLSIHTYVSPLSLLPLFLLSEFYCTLMLIGSVPEDASIVSSPLTYCSGFFTARPSGIGSSWSNVEPARVFTEVCFSASF